eukprot:1149687-Pelagomonas_calceolata.AAC.3
MLLTKPVNIRSCDTIYMPLSMPVNAPTSLLEDGDKETGTSGLGAWDEEDERMLWGATVQQASVTLVLGVALQVPHTVGCHGGSRAKWRSSEALFHGLGPPCVHPAKGWPIPWTCTNAWRLIHPFLNFPAKDAETYGIFIWADLA